MSASLPAKGDLGSTPAACSQSGVTRRASHSVPIIFWRNASSRESIDGPNLSARFFAARRRVTDLGRLPLAGVRPFSLDSDVSTEATRLWISRLLSVDGRWPAVPSLLAPTHSRRY